MLWSDEVKSQETDKFLGQLFKLIDLTSLNVSDTDSSIAFLCEKAQGQMGHVAGVCVYPRFVKLIATQFLNTKIKTVTVANFPEGTDSLAGVLTTINCALTDGAQEIDVVFPYSKFLAGDKEYAQEFIITCKVACGSSALLKVILETGVFQDAEQLKAACECALTSGADFLKTSTGKIAQGASLSTARILLLAIKAYHQQTQRRVGIKFSGGIQTIAVAADYINLTANTLGSSWIHPDTLRIGASKLVDDINLTRSHLHA